MNATPDIEGVVDLVEIGRGGFGVVYRGTETAFSRDVAVKILMPSLDVRTQQRFERERRAMGAVSGHPNIVTVYRGGVTATTHQPYLVMEYLRGGSLGDYLTNVGPIDWRSVASIGVKLAEALAVAHRAGILHRDVKPANVFKTEDGEPKLGDFGIARLDDGQDSRSGSITASIAHAPPEIIDGKRGDERSDIYSLASTLYTLAIGAPPFARDPDQGLARMLSRISTEPPPRLHLETAASEFEAVLMRGLSKRPEDRPQTVAELGAQLRRAAAATTGPIPLRAETVTAAAPPSTLVPAPQALTAPQESAPAPAFAPSHPPGAAGHLPPDSGPPGVSANTAVRRGPGTGSRSMKPVQIAGIVALVLAVAGLGGWAIGRSVFGSEPPQQVATSDPPANDPQSATVPAIAPTAPPIPTTAAAEPTPTALPQPTPTEAPVPTPTRVTLTGGSREATLSASTTIDGYTAVSDPSGAINLEVPTSWTATTQTSDDLADAGFELNMPYRALAAGGTFLDLSGIPDIRDLSKSGIAIFATRLETEAAPATLLLSAALVKWQGCDPGEEAEIEVDGGTAAYQILACDEDDTGVIVLVVVDPDDPFVVVSVDLQFADIAELGALPTIISTIRVDPTKVPQSAG